MNKLLDTVLVEVLTYLNGPDDDVPSEDTTFRRSPEGGALQESRLDRMGAVPRGCTDGRRRGSVGGGALDWLGAIGHLIGGRSGSGSV